jgi:acetyl-CoA carboxylase biotin carboxyl carrier protein
MDEEAIRNILDLVAQHDLAEFELEVEGLKIRVKKSGGTHMVEMPAGPVQAPLPSVVLTGAGPAAVPRHADVRPQAVPGAGQDADLVIVTSPIVGTFYRAPEPGAPPFVDQGAQVKQGQVLCIIEAMKLMNEIECDRAGEVVAVYVENGRPVQYGERLFAIRPA